MSIHGFQSLYGLLKTGMIVALALMAASPALPQGLRLQETIVTDRWSGAAIGGFDPVAYFVENRAVEGQVAHHWVQDGIVWHFRSEGNRAAFRESPESYQPAFGGHDPVMVASGVPVAGHPHLFAIVEGRLYLFRRAENRALFLADAGLRKEAHRLWPELRRQLTP